MGIEYGVLPGAYRVLGQGPFPKFATTGRLSKQNVKRGAKGRPGDGDYTLREFNDWDGEDLGGDATQGGTAAGGGGVCCKQRR